MEKPATLVHHFFAGARRSTRAPRPSMKIVDPDNVAVSSLACSKRKAADGPGTKRRVSRKIIPASSASSDDARHDSDGDLAEGTDTEADEDLDDTAETSYVTTKAMGDADREAGTTRLKRERTADICTIFAKKDGHLDPHTGLLESGHVCTICE
ncbi:hypothetical protein DFH29DRAFT_846984 [Suillus ampliporus]|nr:hypothetical protein DFH29DRAFT_846984 [Suillus ampliporus]